MVTDLHPDVYPTGDGEFRTAGSSDGDWRPAQPPRPHGYDFDQRFANPPHDWAALDPDDHRLRNEHERELDAHDPAWRRARYERFSDDFGRWRQERGSTAARYEPGTAAAPR